MAKDAVSNTQGGGFHEPLNQRRAGGPRPARHIPWPELFKHHQSVLTGHLKMMDMVRKHCVAGTGNYDTAKACVDRTNEMIKMFKQATWNFVAPKDNMDRVPLGASSASMYPGYSPADHIYGEAAQEYGEYAAGLKRKGVEMKPEPTGPQYVVGRRKRPRRLSQESEGSQFAAGSSAIAQVRDSQGRESQPMEGVEQSTTESQYFTIDPNPIPLADMGEARKNKNKANDQAKRRVSFIEEESSEIPNPNHSSVPKAKKLKLTTGHVAATTADSHPAMQEDISAEVEDRIRAREEKRKRKEEKKRKRDSRDSLPSDQPDAAMTPAEGPVRTSSVTNSEPSAKASQEKGSKKSKNKMKEVDSDIEAGAASGKAENEKSHKRRKKEVASST